MPPAKRKTAAKPARKAAAKAKPAAKSAAKAAAAKRTPAIGDIPLKSRSIWVIDTESAQFKAARRRDAEALGAGDADRDGMAHAEGLFIDKDVQKWWT